ATNLDLAAAVERGAFRMDLFYRLNVFQIAIPPLRERPDDILPLTQHFIGIYNRSFNRAIQGVSKDAAAALLRHSWPGNVRQLRNTVERAMVMEDSPLIELGSLPHEIGGLCLSPGSDGPDEDLSLARSEQRLMVRALEKSHGNQTMAARMLGITRDGLRYKVRKHGLPIGRAHAAGQWFAVHRGVTGVTGIPILRWEAESMKTTEEAKHPGPDAYVYARDLRLQAKVPENGILSQTLHSDERSKVILFGFAAGQELSAHTASYPATLLFLKGDALLKLGGEEQEAVEGSFVYMPPYLEHGIKARNEVVMLLTMIKGGA